MKTDDRDERIASILDEAVYDITVGTPGAPASTISGIGRSVRSLAAVAAAAVFVAGVVFASGQFGRDSQEAANTGQVGVFASPDFRWKVPIPAGWRAGAARWVGGPQEILNDLRTSFVSTSSTASVFGTLMVESQLPRGIVDSDVIVVVDPFGGTAKAEPAALVLNARRQDRENPGWTWRDGKLCGVTGCARVYVWHGPDASSADLATAVSVAAGIRIVETRPDPSVLAPLIGYRDGEDGFSMSYPAGWTVADEALTPQAGRLSREILSVGTFPLEPGGIALAPFDSLLPGNAIADIGPRDVFVTVEERTYPGASTFPRRPSPFDRETACGQTENSACVDNALGLDKIRTWWLPFSDPGSGRGFYVFVAMGEVAYRDTGRSAAAWAILESLRFPKTLASDPPAELPPPVRDFRSEFVSAERGYRFWPRSGRAERGVVYRFEVPHCGLGWLVDFDGSFWEDRSSIFGNDWIPADEIPDGDIGTIEFVGHDGARYEASDGTWTLLSRVDGPVVRQPCD